MFATLFGVPDWGIAIFLGLCIILWAVKDVFKAANGPVGRGLWDIFMRGK